MTEELEAAGVDPDHTPVDRLPEQGAWAIFNHIAELQGEVYE